MQTVIFGDCRAVLKRLKSESFHLIVTSPPYNLGIKYHDWNDNLSCDDYRNFCREWLSECYRVLVVGGRLCLNIPFFTYKGGRNVLFEYFTLLKELGFQNREMIVWVKKRDQDNDFVCKKKLYGSVASPSNPHIRGVSEMILVMTKKTRCLQGFDQDADITFQEYQDWTKNVWEFDTEGDRRHPAPFPLELPRRLIKLYSYRKNKILDPFVGRGTTLKAAQELDRFGVGIELSKKYLPLIQDTVGENLRICGDKNVFQQVESVRQRTAQVLASAKSLLQEIKDIKQSFGGEVI